MKSNRSLHLLLLFCIFILPLIPAMFDRGYEEIKVLFLLYSMSIVVVFFSLIAVLKKIRVRLTKISTMLILFLISLLVTSFTGINPEQSLLGTSPYFQGLVTFLFLSIFSYILSQTSINERKIYQTLIASASVISSIALIQFISLLLGREVTTYAGRVISTFGQPNFFAGYLLFIIPLQLVLIRKALKYERVFLLVSLSLSILAIAVSFSRTAIILCAILISLWLISISMKTKVKRIILICLVVGGIGYALISSKIIQEEFIQPITKQTVEMANVQKRVFIWQVAIAQIEKHPILGYGLENIGEVYPKQYDFNHPKPAFYHMLKDLNIDNTHNLFLNLFLWGGGVVTLVFCLLIFTLWRTAKSNVLKIGLIVFILWSLLQNLSITHWFCFYLFAGLISKQSIDSKNSNTIQ